MGDWGEGGGGGARSYVDEKAWSSVNHSILSGLHIKQQALEKKEQKGSVLYHFSISNHQISIEALQNYAINGYN